MFAKMSQPAYDAIDTWHRLITGESDKRPVSCNQIKVYGDVLYSYGEHFELARPLRDKRGKVHGYLLNGERYSSTTSQHQSHVRALVQKTGLPVAIIPHPALEQASIDFSTVQVIDSSKDTWETKKHRTTTFPEGARWRTEPVYETQEPTDQDYADALEQAIIDARASWERRVTLHREKPALYLTDPGPFEPPTINDIRLYSKRVHVGNEEKLYQSARSWREIDILYTADGPVYSWTTTEHRLGESLIRAQVVWRDHSREGWPTRKRWAYFLSGFDQQESEPLYFLCELPRGAKPATVAEAYEVLKPDPVLLAEQMGRKVSRQGDIFAVPTRLETKVLKARGARIVRRGEVKSDHDLPFILNTNHTATEVAYMPGGVTLARGMLYHDPIGRDKDHARRKMGDGRAWHIVIKNTVPTAGRR